MTAFNYARAKTTADRLIGRFGQAAVLKRVTNSGTSYDPDQTETRFPCVVAVDAYDRHEIDGTRVQATDRKVLLAPGKLSVEPTPEFRLEIGGVDHAIVDVRPLSPGGVSVYWELQCRR